MDAEARKTLLQIARASVEAAVRGEATPRFEVTHPELRKCGAAFVTLKTGGRLRGCIGVFTADKPLYEAVADLAQQSARCDPRFVYDRLTPQELPQLHLEVSVLSPLQRIDNPLDLDLGKHGIYIKRGVQAGCFLPQVADETGWSKEEFLSHCCAGKAGMPHDAWKDKATEVYTFTAEVIAG